MILLLKEDMGIKGWIFAVCAAIFMALLVSVALQRTEIDRLKEDLSISIANEKALFAERDSLEEGTRVLHMSIEQLNYVNDSIVRKMNHVRNELGIKDKEIQELQYQLSEASKKDTIVFGDTLFRDPELQIDTTIGDRWYNVKLSLEYPSTIAVAPSFISERYTNMYFKKETIRPPKKCKFLRAFQRKHRVMVVEIKEENPYIEVKEERYVKIIE